MFKLLLVSKNTDSFSDFIVALKENGSNEVLYADSGEETLKMVKDNTIDLVITDEELADMSGLVFVRRLISVNPFINCAAISHLSEKEFHEESEGLGLMNHLPSDPKGADAEDVLKTLRQIKGLESGQG
jgi:two-component SAPR family response regulator